MNCMKCGREVEDGQVFCPECLELMAQEPINISVPVHLPQQPPKRNNLRRPVIHLEEEVQRLETASDRMRIWIILLTMASLLLTMALYHKEIGAVADQLGKLRGCEVHSSVILSQVDERTFKRLGVNLTCEPRYMG